MYVFSYWNIYYDSAFLSHPLRLSPTFYQDLGISNQRLSKWPSLQLLPQLPKVYQLLQSLIIGDSSWQGCMCSEEQMQKMESNINTIILHMQCQKKYGFQFWEKSYRRIQASIVHFVIFFMKFIYFIIPESCKSLLEAYKTQKLAIQLAKIELFANQIVTYMKPIHSFLFGLSFQEQKLVTESFLLQFSQLIQNLPKIHKYHFVKVPKLMQYICIINPIEIQYQQLWKKNHIRKKNATSYQENRVQAQNNKSNQNSKFVGSSNKIKRKHKKHSLSKTPHLQKKLQASYQFFIFKDKIRKFSVYKKGRNHTKCSIQTIQKTSSIDKDRSQSYGRTPSPSYDLSLLHERSPTYDLSSSTINEPKLKSQTIAHQVRLRQQTQLLRRQTQNTSISILRSTPRRESIERQEIQYQREEKNKKKKGIKMAIRMNGYSFLQDFTSGKGKGWGIVQQYINKKIIERKLRKLVDQF